MVKLNEIFNGCVKKHDDQIEKRFNDYLNKLIEYLDNLSAIRDNLKSYLVEKADKFEYDPDNKIVRFNPHHHFTMSEDAVLSDISSTVFTTDGIRKYAEGDVSSCEEIDNRLKEEYKSRHPDWFHLEGGSNQRAVFKYPDDGMLVKLTVNCLDVTEIIMKKL